MVLLARKLFHFLTRTFAGLPFLDGLEAPESQAVVPQIAQELFKEVAPVRAGRSASTGKPAIVGGGLFHKLLSLSPVTLFRALSLLYT